MAAEEDANTAATAPPKRPPKRILRFDEVFDLRTYQYRLIKSAGPEKRKLSSRSPVLVVRRIINHKGQHVGTEVDIKSQSLTQVLIEINKGVEGLSLTKVPAVAELGLFFHNRFAIKDRLADEKAQDQPDDALIIDLETCLEFIEEQHGSNIENFDSMTQSKEITWDLLWALLTPNALMYHYHELTEQHQVLLLGNVKKKKRQDQSLYWDITCNIIADDGVKFGLAKEPLALEINEFDGARKIRDLLLYPLHYVNNEQALRAELIERGKKYAKIKDSVYWEITGPAMQETQNDRFEIKQFKFTTHGRAMADASAFRSFNPNITFIPSVHRSLERDKLTDDQLLICSPVALGFSFGDKKWGGLPVSGLRDILWGDEAFRALTIDAKLKTLIRALVMQHSAEKDNGYDDVVIGKGRGLIGLLNGKPGVGKTLTAEAVAEVTKCPLYIVSAGELGIQPAEVDKQLTLVLDLANRWQAVLLLDEADVFLQERSTKDVQRNALVSIFLRQLEYYQGILILTTNRIEACDPAFESRIHFSIHYPDLNREARRQIWKTFLEKAQKAEGISGTITNADLDRLASKEMNGRQIKNTVGSAKSIARDMSQVLNVSHVEIVLDAINAWKISNKS